MDLPAWNSPVDKGSIRSPAERIRMGKASRFNKPSLCLKQEISDQ